MDRKILLQTKYTKKSVLPTTETRFSILIKSQKELFSIQCYTFKYRNSQILIVRFKILLNSFFRFFYKSLFEQSRFLEEFINTSLSNLIKHFFFLSCLLDELYPLQFPIPLQQHQQELRHGSPK